MMNYIGVKAIKAKPMTLQAYNDYRGWELPEDEDGADHGYLVEYLDGGQTNHPDHEGYISWSPRGVFERAYRKTDRSDRISQGDVNRWIDKVDVRTVGKTTIVLATLLNGFVIVEASSCVDPDNYDVGVGMDICMKRIRNKVWELLGFLLQCTQKR